MRPSTLPPRLRHLLNCCAHAARPSEQSGSRRPCWGQSFWPPQCPPSEGTQVPHSPGRLAGIPSFTLGSQRSGLAETATGARCFSAPSRKLPQAPGASRRRRGEQGADCALQKLAVFWKRPAQETLQLGVWLCLWPVPGSQLGCALKGRRSSFSVRAAREGDSADWPACLPLGPWPPRQPHPSSPPRAGGPGL